MLTNCIKIQFKLRYCVLFQQYVLTLLIIISIKFSLKGVVLNTCEGLKQFYGSVATVSGDNPGSSGFKESSAVFRLCRQCMATRDNYHLKVKLLCTTHVVNLSI